MSGFPPFGVNYHGLAASQLMASSSMQPGVHTPNCDAAHAQPVMADPRTGQTICSCQYDRFVRSCFPSQSPAGFSPFSPPGDHSVPSGPSAFLHGHIPPGPNHPPHDSMGMYPGLPGPFADVKDMAGDPATAWRVAQMVQNGAAAAGGYPYDPSFGGGGMYGSSPYCGNNFAMDPAGLNRRKNATRETTSQLKAWLAEHRKNPYPTKGEKIMLAIITKMTLTQVSTWFANARRRLKKENKMTWSPRNRNCEDDDKSDDEGGKDGGDREEGGDKDDDSLSEISSLLDESKRTSSVSPSHVQSKDSLQSNDSQCTAPPANKPRIWSLADMASPGPALSASSPTTGKPPVHPSMSHHPAMQFSRLGAGPHQPPGWPGFFPPGATPPGAPPGGLFNQNFNSAFSVPFSYPGRMPSGLSSCPQSSMVPPRTFGEDLETERRKRDERENGKVPSPPAKMQRASQSSSTELASPLNSKTKPPVLRSGQPPAAEPVKPEESSSASSSKKRKRSSSSDSRISP